MTETETTHQQPVTQERKAGRNVVFWGALFAAIAIVAIIVAVSYGERMVICVQCEGTGKIPGVLFGERTCTNCDGIGKIPSNRCEGCKGTGRDVSTIVDGDISGRGTLKRIPIACPSCGGSGRRR